MIEPFPALAFLPNLARYHAEHARYSGASQELHERALTAVDVAQEVIAALRQEVHDLQAEVARLTLLAAPSRSVARRLVAQGGGSLAEEMAGDNDCEEEP